MNLGTWWSHLDPAVAGGLVGGVVGGFATLIGGFGGAWLVGWLDARREERQQLREHRAAVRAVLYELRTILEGVSGVAGARIDHSFQPEELTNRLPDWAYRAVHPVLLARLPEDVAGAVASAYAVLPTLRDCLSPPAPPRWLTVDAIGDVLVLAHDKLGRYARVSLHMDPPPEPQPLSDGS